MGNYAQDNFIKLCEKRIKTWELRFLRNTIEMCQMKIRNRKADKENLLSLEEQINTSSSLCI